jgi:hypothetical protein
MGASLLLGGGRYLDVKTNSTGCRPPRRDVRKSTVSGYQPELG